MSHGHTEGGGESGAGGYSARGAAVAQWRRKRGMGGGSAGELAPTERDGGGQRYLFAPPKNVHIENVFLVFYMKMNGLHCSPKT